MEKDESKKDSKFTLWFKRNFTVKTIVINSFIAALYAVVTILCGPLSYVGGSLQLRFSEILNLLVFFNPTYSIGLTIGCLLANLMSQYGIFDILLGTLGTLISSLFIILFRKTVNNLFLSSFMPSIINALIVPLIVVLSSGEGITFTTYMIFFGWTFLGEFICITCVGYPIFLILSKKYKGFYELIGATYTKKFLF